MKPVTPFVHVVCAAVTAVVLTAQTLPAEDRSPASSAIGLLIQKAHSLEGRDRDDLAAQVWQQVLIANPNQPEALAGLARWAKHSGRNAEANAYLSRLRKVAPDSPALGRLSSTEATNRSDVARKLSGRLEEANKLAAAGQSAEAMQIFREVFGAAPPAGGWSIAYYETLANTPGGLESAVDALKKLSATYPDSPAYQVSAGKLLTYHQATRRAGIAMLSSVTGSTSAVSEARVAWRQALVWEKGNPAFAADLQSYLIRYPDPELEAASATLRTQAKEQRPGVTDSRTEQLGYQALKLGNLPTAGHEFERALAENPASARAHAGLGFVRMKTGDFDEAVRQFEAATRGWKPDAALRNALDTARFWQAMGAGAKFAQQGDWANAVTHYQLAAALRPDDPEMVRAFGGALLAAGSPAKAAASLSRLVRIKPLDETAWSALVSAKLAAEGGKAALATIRSLPASLSTSLEHNMQWKILHASVYSAAGDEPRALEIYHQITAGEQTNLTTDSQVQLAGLALRLHDPNTAALYARKAVEAAGDQPGPWEVLLAALFASGKPQEAERVYALMPAATQKIASTHPAFLETLASLTEASGDLDGARTLLERSLAMTGEAASEENRTSTKLHLAQVLAKQRRGAEALALVAGITEAQPNDLDAWRAYLVVLENLGNEKEILSVATRIPSPVATRLSHDPDIVALLARAHGASGDTEFAARLLEGYIDRAGAADSADTSPQRIQLAWLLLGSPNQSGRLYTLLESLNASTDLSEGQRKEVANLWTTWILRSSQAARQAGDEARALGLLQQGVGMFPNSVELRRGLAGNLLASGKTKPALNVYSNWGLTGAQPNDYAGAIGAALAERDQQYARVWLDQALNQWPTNFKILELAGENARSHGDLKKAEAYWKEALAQRQLQQPQQAELAGVDPTQASLKSMLVGAHSVPVMPSMSFRDTGAATLRLSSFNPAGNAPQDFVASGRSLGMGIPRSALGSSYLLKSTPAPVDTLADKWAALESRNTPYLGSSMSVWNRGGEPGFSRLVLQQAQFEASAMITDSLRGSLLLEPTYLSGGSASAQGTSLFGRQTTTASFGPQSASGVAAEAQLSSSTFGLRFGTTPQGFLTSNFMGGIRIQPKGGPITIIVERDSLKDSMLAYAGARDPQSGQIWGGVMANSATVQGRWGGDQSGVYVNGGYQNVEGRNVARNTGLNGNLGTWWKTLALPTGSLTVGMNFSAMHYDRNLRYFTLGQGGYFSPQQYFLFNVPVRWSGVYNHRLQYAINGSLGVQHFVEDASDFYPLDAGLQASTGSRYPATASTGANFNFDGRLNYQLAPHWLLGGFAAASNARNYTATSVGIFAKYTFEERPLSFDNTIPSVPDWRGQQMLILY